MAIFFILNCSLFSGSPDCSFCWLIHYDLLCFELSALGSKEIRGMVTDLEKLIDWSRRIY